MFLCFPGARLRPEREQARAHVRAEDRPQGQADAGVVQPQGERQADTDF